MSRIDQRNFAFDLDWPEGASAPRWHVVMSTGQLIVNGIEYGPEHPVYAFACEINKLQRDKFGDGETS